MAPIETHAVVERRFSVLLVFVAGIGQPAVGLKQHGWAEVLLAVPPIRGAGRRATGTQNTLVQSVELLAVRRTLTDFTTLVCRKIEQVLAW